jgi:uncharacterized protein YraI
LTPREKKRVLKTCIRPFVQCANAVVASAALSLLGASGALAISAPIHIANTGGEGVFIRPEPNTSQPAIGWIPEGASPDYNCFAWGQNVNGVPIWFNVNYNGKTGYYASYYDDSSYHSNEELTAKYGVPLCGSAPPSTPSAPPTSSPGADPAPPPSSSPPPSAGGLVFSIFNADGGVYYRRSPDWSDTPKTPGSGVYNGDQVVLICGAMGDSIGPYNNKAWSKVRNLSRPVGEGWVNEHFINDGAPSNSFPAGEPMCGASANTFSGGSLYFSPYPENPHGPDSTGQIKGNNPLHIGTNWVSAPSRATVTLHANEWDENRDSYGCPSLDAFVPKDQPAFAQGRISTLAAWSRARSAPFLFLRGQEAWRPRIHYILLFDPGNLDEWDSAGCAQEYPLSGILRDWLIESAANRLVILSGALTADVGHKSVDGHGHAGIQNALFVPLKRQPDPPNRHLRAQIVVCNYDTMSHPDVWINFKEWMNKPPIKLGSCPSNPSGEKVVSWNP